MFIAKWLFTNALVCYGMIALNEYYGGRGYVLLALGFYGSAQMGIKFIFSLFNHLKFYLYENCFKLPVIGLLKKKYYAKIKKAMDIEFDNKGKAL